MKLLLENWKRFVLSEQPESAVDKVKDVLDTIDYKEFVTKLADIAGDPKVRAVLKAGRIDGFPNDENITISRISVAVKDLSPTQNEVDLGNSLSFPLAIPSAFERDLAGEDVLVDKKPIVIAEGRYIIDGHHRWSEVYCINQDATIAAYNIEPENTDVTGPLDYLKIVQLSIAAVRGDIPIEKVTGLNLFDIDLDAQLLEYIERATSKEVRKFVSTTFDTDKPIEFIHDLVRENILSMRETSSSVEGAPERKYMPQTGDAAGWDAMASRGMVNFKEPLEEKKFPFHEKRVNENVFVRTFDKSIDENELIWHRDRETRTIRIIEGKEWGLQLDNQMPFKMVEGKEYIIPQEEWHRVIKGTGKLVVEIKKERRK
jgi:hypothetical protein